MKSNCKKLITTIAAISVTFFSLCSCVIAAVAWFSVANQAKTEGETFKVIASGDGGCEIDEVNLYKFNYTPLVIGSKHTFDYLTPWTGDVSKYLYEDGKNDNNAIIGFSKKYDEIVDDEWTFTTVNPAVSLMNAFDPVYMTINGQNSLIQMNCNAIYEVILSSSKSGTCYLQLDSIKKDPRAVSEVYLTDCLDFDAYLQADLSNAALNNNAYYPSYYERLNRSLTDFEETYYKISYLSSLNNSVHAHFYGEETKPANIHVLENKQVTFSANEKLKVYINVNYSYNELKKFSDKLYLGDITAYFDFAFSFTFTDEKVIAGVELNETELTLSVDQTATLTATTSPQDATSSPVTWASSDSAVATVTNGVVRAISAGTAIITAKCNDRTATCVVTVPEVGEGE